MRRFTYSSSSVTDNSRVNCGSSIEDANKQLRNTNVVQDWGIEPVSAIGGCRALHGSDISACVIKARGFVLSGGAC